MIDAHSHILPGIDDGSASLEESISMLRVSAQQGVSHVIATPHFYAHHDKPERFLEKRAQAEAALRQEMARHEGIPKLHIGAEVYFFSGISDSELINQLTIDKKRCILIEMPSVPWTESMFRELEEIHRKQGLTPVIAHVDRYIRPFHTYKIPERLAELPVLVQANASFFLHPSTAGMAMRLLRRDQIHLLGSDCHDLTDRKPNLGAAAALIKKRLGEAALARLKDYGDELLGREFV